MIVAFSGPKGAGKSTAMRALGYRAHPEGDPNDELWTHVSFAAPLKAMLAELIRQDAIHDRELREKPHPLLCDKTPRYAMQTLGTEWGRQCIGEDVWVNAWRERALAVLDAGGHVVTDDLRFPNEEAAVKALGGCIIEIARPGVQRDGAPSGMLDWVRYWLGRAPQGHASEAYTPNYDAKIVNDGTAAQLQANVQESVEWWERR